MDWKFDQVVENQEEESFWIQRSVARSKAQSETDHIWKQDWRLDWKTTDIEQILHFTIVLKFSSSFTSNTLPKECEAYFLYR